MKNTANINKAAEVESDKVGSNGFREKLDALQESLDMYNNMVAMNPFYDKITGISNVIPSLGDKVTSENFKSLDINKLSLMRNAIKEDNGNGGHENEILLIKLIANIQRAYGEAMKQEGETIRNFGLRDRGVEYLNEHCYANIN